MFLPFACQMSFLFCLVALVSSTYLGHQNLNASFLDSYDYIIVGGGVSGLVVANRLTEDPNVNVLVVEAGNLDNYEDYIMYPFDNGEGLGSIYDWNLWTAPQTFLDGKPRPYDLGKGIGGGSLINGMCWTRGGSPDYDAWVTLGNDGWGWEDLLPYFKKAENYTDNVRADFARELYINPSPNTHNTDGYVHVSYPKFFYNQSQLFLDGLQELGIPTLYDPNNGTSAGGMLIPNSMSPDNQTRSDARLAYFNGFIDTRPNFHVITGLATVKVLVDENPTLDRRDLPAGLWISGVEIAPALSTVTRVISCSREVILAAGNVHSPQILELSGIGQADILESLDIPVVIDLPGVGNNYQDHPYVGVVYYYSNTSYLTTAMIDDREGLLNQTEQEYYVNKSGPWTGGAINTVAFPSLPWISTNWTNMAKDASSQSATLHLLPDLDPTIVAGYSAQKAILVDLLSRPDVGVYEILNDNLGLLAVAAMHTFSRGSVHIQTANPYDPPVIDPRYCSNPLDCQILVEGLLFNNKILNTTAMRLLQPIPYSPFFQDANYTTLMPAVNSGIRTEFHGSGATSMMPREMGGVVDTHLRVYGTKNLRIVDAGIIPLVPAAHLQAPVYAIAEKAADLIKLDNYQLTPQGCGPNSSFAQNGPVEAQRVAVSSPPMSTSVTVSPQISSILSFEGAVTATTVTDFFTTFETVTQLSAPSSISSGVVINDFDTIIPPIAPSFTSIFFTALPSFKNSQSNFLATSFTIGNQFLSSTLPSAALATATSSQKAPFANMTVNGNPVSAVAGMFVAVDSAQSLVALSTQTETFTPPLPLKFVQPTPQTVPRQVLREDSSASPNVNAILAAASLLGD